MPKSTAPPERYSQGWLQSLDGRTEVAQTLRARWESFTNDLGGVDRLSYAQKALVERALWLEYFLQQQELTLANGGDFDSGRYTQAANSFQGLLVKLGLDRQARDVPDLAAFLSAKQAKP